MDERRKEALPRNHQYTNPHPSDLPAMAGTGGISQRTPSRTADKGPGTRYGNRCTDPKGDKKASFRYRHESLRRFPRLCDDLRSPGYRSEEHTSELQSRENLVCRLLLEKKKRKLRQS